MKNALISTSLLPSLSFRMCVCVCVQGHGAYGQFKRFLPVLFMMLLFLPSTSHSQCAILKNPVIYGGYEDHPGTHHIRLYINFIRDPDTLWVNQQQADSLGGLAFQYLNDAYNPYGAYFVNPASPCSPPTANLITTELDGINTIRNTVPGSKHDDGIDMYIRDTSGTATGWAFEVPNTYFYVTGADNGTPAAQTSVAVHEMGHCLGLLHTFHSGCDNLSGCATGVDTCYCTGDFVCDTPPTISDNIACTVPILGTNYMSYTTQDSCRDNFTAEQASRMRAHLAGHDSLQNVIIPAVDSVPSSGPSGNIVVSTGELHVTSTLEMLPGAYILVEPGATLRVSAKITGACGQMWRGVILQGNNLASQIPANQGRVIVDNNGIIEHAECGIEARLVGENGTIFPASGGGIVNVTGGQFINNITGIRFGTFTGPNVSYIQFGDFYTDENYRVKDTAPTHLELINVSNLRINACEFRDYRTGCEAPTDRAIGISSTDAGFRAESLCRFENLYTGIYANNLTPNSGSFVVNNNRFKACNIGLFTRSTSDFFFEDNGLYVSLADGCEENEYIHEAVGVTLSGTTAGFTFRGNYFHYDEATMPEDSLIGVECINLSEGLNNQIKGNTYENMFTAHRAIGNNGYFEDGLVYLCDSMAISYSAIPEEIEIKDFFVRQGGTIRQNQQDDNTLDAPLPTGNIFSGIGGYSFYNPDTSQIINYLYYGGSAQQDPASADLGYIGILPEAANEGNANCFTQVEPCTPPCDKEDIDEVKEDFHDTKALWEEQKEAYSLIEDEEEQQIALDSIIRLRRAMNRYARLILMTHSLDTAAIQTDSILAWLALAETYPTDYRLARHYFFTGEFDKHDTLWAAIPNRYDLDETQLAELDEIETVLNTIRPDLVTGTPLSCRKRCWTL
ncbi:MAG: hypothetical protein H6560_14620 [Lewinellaceae bacterium]|nr:hypothetical protein [Lewinellaceae bacterium]